MVELRPLIVVTGTLHVEGGVQKKTRSQKTRREEDRTIVVEDRKVHSDRREANVIATDWLRKLRAIKILTTPYGRIVDPKRLPELKNLIAQATVEASKFNETHQNCSVACTLIWEYLKGNRRDALCGWLEMKRRERDEDVIKILPQLKPEAEAA